MPTLTAEQTSREKIAELNDAHRRLVGTNACRCYLTQGVAALPPARIAALLAQVAAFDAFTPENNPHREHDFGAMSLNGVNYFWKIDYYDARMEMHSPDPSDPARTVRVLTVMRADEY